MEQPLYCGQTGILLARIQKIFELMRFLGWPGSTWPFVLVLISAESAIGILS